MKTKLLKRLREDVQLHYDKFDRVYKITYPIETEHSTDTVTMIVNKREDPYALYYEKCHKWLRNYRNEHNLHKLVRLK